ncbi:MAG: HmuY family protein [Treponema sp.]|jgi:hypothetical protein|nr:HmuY family protein [Treponema sp.]
MIFSKPRMFLNILLLGAVSLTVLLGSCDTSGNDDDDTQTSTTPGLYENDPAETEIVEFAEDADYLEATINVDYNGANNAVFFDFSTGTKTVVPHDFFDIAIDGSGTIIANSGSFGSGVQVYKTEETDLTKDFSSEQDKVIEYTFKETLHPDRLFGYQTAQNPLGELGMTTSEVCLVKVKHKSTDADAYFKVTFGMNMPGAGGYSGPPQYVMTVVPGLGAGEANKKELACPITGLTGATGYGWLYFKLVGDGAPKVLNTGTTWTGGGTAVPLAANWDILGTRTNELQEDPDNPGQIAEEMKVASRSSILLNTYKSVKAGVVTEKLIDEVPTPSAVELRTAVDAIGYSWYSMAGMPPAFSVASNTYIIKTVEGRFAKFQPESFYGPNNESFVMDFAYSYEE